MLTYLLVIFLVLLFFGASIFLHEYGHYWVARKLGLQVDEFAIGFGPKICSFKVDGIDWSLRWIPAGGFVKLPQLQTSEVLEGDYGDNPLPAITPRDKILVSLAGPFMNVVFAFAVGTLIYFTGIPERVNPSEVGVVEKGSAEEKMGIKEGDVITEIDGRPVDTWEDIMTYVALAPKRIIPVGIKRGDDFKIYQLETIGEEENGIKQINLYMRDIPVVGQVQEDSPASRAGLQSKDKILEFNGEEVESRQQLIELVNSRKGEETELIVMRGNERVSALMTPEVFPGEDRARIGIAFLNGGTFRVRKPGPLPWETVGKVTRQTLMTIGALSQPKKTGVGISDLSGPVGIFANFSYYLATDIRLALGFLVLLNINLAILNLLPIPVLDGGHITFSLIEWITRKPMKGKIVEVSFMVCFVMLISLMLYVLSNDVRRMGMFKSMFQNEVRIEEADSPE